MSTSSSASPQPQPRSRPNSVSRARGASGVSVHSRKSSCQVSEVQDKNSSPKSPRKRARDMPRPGRIASIRRLDRAETLYGTYKEKEQIDFTPHPYVEEGHAVQNVWKIFLKLRRLGIGASAEVYLVQYREATHLGKFALKTIKKTNFTKLIYEQEINMLKALEHPGICKYYDTYEDKGRMYIVEELCMGGELFDRIRAVGRFRDRQAAKLVRSIVSTVAFMHSKDIVHRDLKPENLLFKSAAADSPLKIVDFGFARKIKPEKVYHEIVGAALYVCPELVEAALDQQRAPKGNVLKPADMWAIGVITYTLLTGCHLFYGDTDDVIFRDILRCRIEFSNVDISFQAQDFITSLLQKNPFERLTAKQALDHPWLVEKHQGANNGSMGRIGLLQNPFG